MSILCIDLFLFKRSELCFAGNKTIEYAYDTASSENFLMFLSLYHWQLSNNQAYAYYNQAYEVL